MVQIVNAGINDGYHGFLAGVSRVAHLPGLIDLRHFLGREHVHLVLRGFRHRQDAGQLLQGFQIAPANVVGNHVHQVAGAMDRLQTQLALGCLNGGLLPLQGCNFSSLHVGGALRGGNLQSRRRPGLDQNPNDFIRVWSLRRFIVFCVDTVVGGEEFLAHLLFQSSQILRAVSAHGKSRYRQQSQHHSQRQQDGSNFPHVYFLLVF